MLVKLDHIIAFDKLVHDRSDKKQRNINVAHKLDWLKLFDIETMLLLNFASKKAQYLLKYKTWQNRSIDSNLFNQLPERSIGRIQDAGDNVFAIFGVVEIEDDSK